MKLIIDKKIRTALLFSTSILVILSGLLLFKSIKYPGLKEEKRPLYNYSSISTINCNAILKHNALYEDGAVLGDDSVILSEFLDTIKADFKYQFNGERTADINGDYDIVALLEGTTGTDKDQKTIWQKTFPISEKQNFQSHDKSLVIDKEISIKPKEYKDFAQSLASISKVDSQVKLSVLMNINLKAVTDKGVITKRLSPSLVIPINSNYFQITKNLGTNKPEAIQKVEKGQLPVNKNTVRIFSVLLSIFILALLYVILFVKSVEDGTPKEKELRRIFKDYGDRMVTLSNSINLDRDYCYKVRTMEDLVKVSDELIKPIMYKYSSDVNSIGLFYVCDDKSTYIFDINEQSREYEAEEIKTKNPVEA